MFHSLSKLIKALTMATKSAAFDEGLSIVTRRPASASNACDDCAAAPCCESDFDYLQSCDKSMLFEESVMPRNSASEGIQGRSDRVGEGFCSPDLQAAGLAQPGGAARIIGSGGLCSRALAASSKEVVQEGIRDREYRLAAGFCSPRQVRLIVVSPL